jgi:hypothetical protein
MSCRRPVNWRAGEVQAAGLAAIYLGAMGCGRSGRDLGQWTVGSGLPLRRPPGSGVDERIIDRVLGELGLPPDGDPREYAAAYRLFLPHAARQGVRPLLRDARRGPGGKIDPGDPAEQIDWLAGELRIVAPDGRDLWWQKTWDRAVERSGIHEPPAALSQRARLLLVRRLASAPSYPSLLVDALAEAMRHDAS